MSLRLKPFALLKSLAGHLLIFGIRRNQLYKWKEQLNAKGNEAFPNKRGRPCKDQQSELVTLKQENDRLKEEVEILKKAAAYFA